MKIIFKRTSEEEEKSIIGKLWNLVVEFPLNFLRDMTIPISEDFVWDRNKACIYPLITPIAFMFLNGNLKDNFGEGIKVASYLLIPGVIFAIFIRMFTYTSKPP